MRRMRHPSSSQPHMHEGCRRIDTRQLQKTPPPRKQTTLRAIAAFRKRKLAAWVVGRRKKNVVYEMPVYKYHRIFSRRHTFPEVSVLSSDELLPTTKQSKRAASDVTKDQREDEMRREEERWGGLLGIHSRSCAAE
ncbi:hypothetical protein RB195_019293 [Necator americanus]|uniref:Uncharacterized protein n=1 Tax=Necator americanus TaxID=51031 RepID=A0ABR1CDH9_NECAM